MLKIATGKLFDHLSDEAKQTIVGMVEYCLNRGLCMGMDEGYKSFAPGIKHNFRTELENLQKSHHRINWKMRMKGASIS